MSFLPRVGRPRAEERLFDTAYFPGIAPGESNRFNLLERDTYAEATAAILAGGARREEFFRRYAFFVRAATDDRPYFFHFFRWRALPLALLRRRAVSDRSASPRPASRRTRLFVLIYFLALGVGYLFVEMALIQRLVFFLANPIYAVAVVLAGLLLVSGLGSGWAARRLNEAGSALRMAAWAALAVAATATLYAFGLRGVLLPLLGWPLGARMAVALVVMLPLATMGMPFPLGLRHLGLTHAELLPWAWAINGCASVVATSLATLVALGTGLVAVLVAAAASYAAAALVAHRWQAENLSA